MRCPDTAAFRLSPFLVARPLTRLAIRSDKSHPGLQTQPQPVRNLWKAIALARSDHPTAMGESEPSVTLRRTSPPAIVWYHQEPRGSTETQRHPAIDATDTSASRTWVHVGQPALKTALKASHKAHYRPEECLGSHGARPRLRFDCALITCNRKALSRLRKESRPRAASLQCFTSQGAWTQHPIHFSCAPARSRTITANSKASTTRQTQ